MNRNVIIMENVSKQYRLGTVGLGTLAQDLNRIWYRILGREDPYATVGEENDRTHAGTSRFVWALRNLNLHVREGEVLGIIGKNGAGKSTLLKILSRITTPSTGSVKIRGRIASLLEVGTGFHPELTGRENIFLNGSIMGMSRTDIIKRFDEIVDFAGVQRYIDTPVKRYSSGMYVRLAFAVAAHLDPDILVVDEVLSVGDAEFQKKALGKIRSVSHTQGRTVLVVSHNLSSITALCSRCILMERGLLKFDGDTESVVAKYLTSGGSDASKSQLREEDLKQAAEENYWSGEKTIACHSVLMRTDSQNATLSFQSSEKIFIEMDFSILKKVHEFRLLIVVRDSKGNPLISSCSVEDEDLLRYDSIEPGRYNWSVELPPDMFGDNEYFVGIFLTDLNHFQIRLDNIFKFSIHFRGYNGITKVVNSNSPLKPRLKWRVI